MRSRGSIVLLVIVLVVGLAGCAGCNTYNSLVAEDERVEATWGDLQAQYQRRSDLIPNLVSTVEGSAGFERETLEAVVNARARATQINIDASDLDDPERLRQFQEAQSELSRSLGRLLAVAENYPQLRSTEAFRDLQVQLEGTENRINTARRDYNESVRVYNTRVRRFPAALFAGLFGFDTRTPFEADADAQDAPTVDFNS